MAACNKASAAAQAADDSEYFASVSLHGSRFQPPPTAYFALQAALDQEFVPNTPGAVLDSAGMLTTVPLLAALLSFVGDSPCYAHGAATTQPLSTSGASIAH